jgi:hypothetical protein
VARVSFVDGVARRRDVCFGPQVDVQNKETALKAASRHILICVAAA